MTETEITSSSQNGELSHSKSETGVFKGKCISFTQADTEINLNYYHGKDVLHQGCLLALDSEKAWASIQSRVRNKIRKAEKIEGIEIKQVPGNVENVQTFREIWFNPEDSTLPDELEEDEYLYLAYENESLVGGLILTPVTKSVLYMHNLGSNQRGKEIAVPSLLLWHAVKDLSDSHYRFIDVGVSFRKNLWDFFSNFACEYYPIIFEPPVIKPSIALTPFSSESICKVPRKRSKKIELELENSLGSSFTIVPRAVYAISALLKEIGLEKSDDVAIFKTFNDNDYISSCVTNTIETVCRWSREIHDKTKAIMVIHEFGYFCREIQELRNIADKMGIPLIENCAWVMHHKNDPHTGAGTWGDYAIYSLPKIFKMQFGGLITGMEISDKKLWSDHRVLDHFKREVVLSSLLSELGEIDASVAKKRDNVRYLTDLFMREGIDCVLPENKMDIPSAALIKCENSFQLRERYLNFGIETGVYYPWGGLFVPTHQNLSKDQMDYVYGVFRGTLNLCRNYRPDKTSQTIERRTLSDVVNDKESES